MTDEVQVSEGGNDSNDLLCDSCHPLYLLSANFGDAVLEDLCRACGVEDRLRVTAHGTINHNRNTEDHVEEPKSIENDEIPDIIHNQSRSEMSDVVKERWARVLDLKVSTDPVKEGLAVRLSFQAILDLGECLRNVTKGDNKLESQLVIDYTDDLNDRISADQWDSVLQSFRKKSGLADATIAIQANQERLISVTIHVSAVDAAKYILTWINAVYPRPVTRERSCWSNSLKVDIGSCEVKDSNSNTTLLEYRRFLLGKFLAVGLGKAGNFVDPDNFYVLPTDATLETMIFVVSESPAGDKCAFQVPIGRIDVQHVVDATSETYKEMTAEQFHNLRMQIVKGASETGHLESLEVDGQVEWNMSAANLATLSMNYEILRKNSNTDITLVPGVGGNQLAQDSLLVMYNYTRITSILNKFEELVSKEDYPRLPNIDQIDLSHLSSSEELDLLRVLWIWPNMLQKIVDSESGEISAVGVLKCVKELAVSTNKFYTSQIVLVATNCSHNFEAMFARLHLLQACRKVFEEFLELIQVEFGPRSDAKV